MPSGRKVIRKPAVKKKTKTFTSGLGRRRAGLKVTPVKKKKKTPKKKGFDRGNVGK